MRKTESADAAPVDGMVMPLGCGDNGCEFHRLQQRLRQVEDALHMALCIIENDAGLPTAESIGEVRRRWVAEIEQESGIDRELVMRRTSDD